MDEHILVLEDEEALLMTLSDRLASEGYRVDSARDGEEGLSKAIAGHYDLITLDLMLPRKNGFDVCRDLRQRGITTPILMLTARGQTADKVVGLKLGADDYLTKPFESLELLARIEALLRRSSQSGRREALSSRQFGPIIVDLRGTEVTRGGEVVSLSAREFQLLKYFIEHQGATVSRDEILRDVWGYSTETFTRTVDVHVASLRQKIEEHPKNPELIVTVAGLGYKFAQ